MLERTAGIALDDCLTADEKKMPNVGTLLATSLVSALSASPTLAVTLDYCALDIKTIVPGSGVSEMSASPEI